MYMLRAGYLDIKVMEYVILLTGVVFFRTRLYPEKIQ